MLALLKLVLYVPLYNGLVFLIGALPGHSVGLAVILLTLCIKLALFPLSYKATKFQFEMKAHEADINRIKAEFKHDKQAQGKAVLDFYKEKGINPFAGMLPLLIQIPIVIALYYVFAKGGFPDIDSELLYGFVAVPDVTMFFFGLDIAAKSLTLAIIVGISQLLQGHLAMPPAPAASKEPSFGNDLARGMQLQMKYVLPVVMAFVAYSFSGAVALYLITSNLWSVGQELYLRGKFKKEGHLTHTTN